MNVDICGTIQKAARWSTVAMLLSSVSPAIAQVASPAEPAQSQEQDGENEAMPGDIVVTANKRQESVNDVAMSITALSSEQLDRAGIASVEDLVRVTPGYTFSKTHDSVPVLSIRGVGYYDNSLAATPAVSTYIDEVPLPYPVMTAGALLDLERVEVLKGPQGTLFGQNSTGGALNFIAAKPKDAFEGRIALGYGRFDTFEANGHVTGPLTDTLSARISASFEHGSHWQHSFTRKDGLGDVERGAARLLLDWRPSDRLKVAVGVEGWYDKSASQAAQIIGLGLQIPGLQNPALAVGDDSPGNPVAQIYPNSPRNPRAADWTPGRDYSNDHRYGRASLRADYELSDGVSLSSITAWQGMHYENAVDADGTALEIAYLPAVGTLRSFYQEARLRGETGRLTWMVGGNYSRDRVSSFNAPQFGDWSVPINNQTITMRTTSRTLAVFSNAEYAFDSGIKLIGGLRYTDTQQRMVGCPADSGDGFAAGFFNAIGGTTDLLPGQCYSRNDLDGSLTPGLADLNLKENNLSWRVGVNYEPNARTLLYANLSRGYKAGAFTLPTFNVFSQALPATQETLLAYEAGFKFGGRAFQINGAAFYYDYQDKQLLAPFETVLGILDKLQNIPSSRIIGAELQLSLYPIDGLTLSANGTFVDSKVTSSFIAASPFGGTMDLQGDAFPYTPRWQSNGDVNYKFSISEDFEASLGASLSYHSRTNGRFGGGDLYELKPYVLLDLRAGIETSDGKYAFDIWGRNVTNTYYRVNTTTFADTVIAFTGQPATFGARASIRF